MAIRNRVGEIIVLTPDDPDGFVELLTSVPLADSMAGPDPHAGSGSSLRVLVIAGIVLLVTAFVSFIIVAVVLEVRGNIFFQSADGRIDIREVPSDYDARLIGAWRTVASVAEPEDFVPGPSRTGGAEYVFHEGGAMHKSWFTWRGGYVFHTGGNKTAARYEIRDISGTQYMFLEHMSRDVAIHGMRPKYHVLRKLDG